MKSAHVFLNVPFDKGYQDLFIALVVGVVAHGALPHCVVELDAAIGRLDRLRALVKQCGVSFHDLSRVQCTRHATFGLLPRFNMPFELGLAVMKGGSYFLLEERSHRIQASLSDLNGYDPLIHHGNPRTLLARVSDALAPKGKSPSVSEMHEVYETVRPNVLRRVRAGSGFFARRTFFELTDIVIAACEARGIS